MAEEGMWGAGDETGWEVDNGVAEDKEDGMRGGTGFGKSSSLWRLRFLERGVRLMQLFLPIVTSHSPLSRSELLHSDRAAATIAALCCPGGVLVFPPCCNEKCSGNIAIEGLEVGGGGGGEAMFGEGFSPS